MHEFLEPWLQVRQGWDVREASVAEGGSVVSLGGREPAKDPRQPVVVVVLGELGQCGLGMSEAREALAVEDLGLQDVPEGFDLAIRPRRVDLGAQVPDAQSRGAVCQTR